jgi:maleate cis-trans isomerase
MRGQEVEPTYRARVGFVSGSDHWGTHYDRLLALVPDDVAVEIRGLGMASRSQYDLAGIEAEHVARATKLAVERQWQALACTGAPTQMQNPGLLDHLRQALDIPVTTAVHASGTALRALGVHRPLLLTPFRRSMNSLIQDYLAGLGVEAILHAKDFEEVEEARDLPTEDVYRLAVDAFRAADGAEAIYFQGAVLDPVPVLGRLEAELGVPVVASNPAMLWHALSLLGLRYSLPNGGRLLRDWPALPSA